MDTPSPFPASPQREKIIQAPLAPVLVAASIPLIYFLQTLMPGGVSSLAFQPVTLIEGGWWPGLFSAVLLHGNWGHALLNAAFILAVGTPVARLLSGRGGAAAFFAYYIVCHLVGLVGYASLQMYSSGEVVGASGAAFGLLGGAIRLMGSPGRLRPLTDRMVVTTSLALMAINLATGILNIAPGVIGPGDGTAGIAWEAHAFGYIAGLILIGPLARLFGRQPQRANSSLT